MLSHAEPASTVGHWSLVIIGHCPDIGYTSQVNPPGGNQQVKSSQVKSSQVKKTLYKYRWLGGRVAIIWTLVYPPRFVTRALLVRSGWVRST